MSSQWEVKWWRVGVLLACIFVAVSLAGPIAVNFWIPWHEERELVREYPFLRAVPVPVSDKTIARLDGAHVELFGVALQVPWKEVVWDRTRGNFSVQSFGDDRVLAMFDPSTAFNRVETMQRNGRTQAEEKAIRETFGPKALSSNYDLIAAELAVAPANSNWWATFTQSSRRTVLLTLKLIEMHDAKAIYQINANELHGFQFGNPAVAPYEVWLVLFDRNDRRYEISLHRKENNAPFVSQAEVNAIVASIRPVPHS